MLRIVSPYPAGGANDALARLVGFRLNELLGRQVIVDNRPGAGTTIGSDIVAKAAPDGNTVLITALMSHVVNPSLYKKLPYDTEKDFSPISSVIAGPLVVVVNNGVPARSVAELIALAKSKPEQLNYASSGNGSPTHLAGELFKSMTGVSMTHIPYKGAAPAITEVIGGQVQVMFLNMALSVEFVKAGKLRALAVTGTKRIRLLPEVPTVAETGLAGYEVIAWQALLGPGKMPKDIVLNLNKALVKALTAPGVQETFARQGFEVETNTPEAFERLVSREMVRWGKLAKSIGLQPD